MDGLGCQGVVKDVFAYGIYPHLANGTLKYKFERLIFLIEYAIPKSLSRLVIGQVSYLVGDPNHILAF